MTRRNTAVKTKKATIVKQFGKSESNTGSTESQIALITERINHLNAHLTKFRKDNSTKSGLLKLVGQRRRLLTYLKDSDAQRYAKVISALDLRK